MAEEPKQSHKMLFLKRFADVDVKFKRYSGCHPTKYCSNRCQKKHWPEHTSLCKSIQELIAHNQASSVPSSLENGQYVTHLTPRQHTTVAKLVGKRCIINCKLNELETEALWDTGAQVFALPKRWVAEQFPMSYIAGIELRNIEELVGQGVQIELKAANGTDIPYSGWIELEFKLMSGADVKNNCAITVPFLVSPLEEVNCVILGFNVFEEMLNSNDMNDKDTDELMLSMMKASFMETKPQKVEALVNFIQSNVLNSSDLCSVKTGKRDTLIPRGGPKLFNVRQISMPHQGNSLFFFNLTLSPF